MPTRIKKTVSCTVVNLLARIIKKKYLRHNFVSHLARIDHMLFLHLKIIIQKPNPFVKILFIYLFIYLQLDI